MANNYYSNQERSFCNPIRILQWLCCAICLVTTIALIVKISSAISILSIVLLLVSISFLFITLIDIAVTSLLKPMLWTAWIAFAFLAFLSFCVCVGFLIAQIHVYSSTALYIWTIVIFAITGLLFLLDIINILQWLKDKKPRLFESESYKTSECSTTETPQPIPSVIVVQEAFTNDLSTSPYSEQSEPVPQKVNCERENCKKRMYNSSATPLSHGGTFHVSRDVAPILNSSMCSNYCYQVAQNSKLNMNKPRTSNYSINRDGPIEVAPKRSRTVSTSVRTVSKQQQLTPPDSEDCKNVCGGQQRHSSAPINPNHNQSVQHPYNCFCSRCGEIHEHVATVAPIISTNNCCGCKEIQQLQEDVKETSLENFYAAQKEYKENKKNIGSSHMCLSPCSKSDKSVQEIYKNEHDTDSLSSVKKKKDKINQTNPFKQDVIETSTSISDHSLPNCPCDKDVLVDNTAIYFEVGDNSSIQSRSNWLLTPDILMPKPAELRTNNSYDMDKNSVTLPGAVVEDYKNESCCGMPSSGCGSININNPTSVTFKYVPREKCRCDFLKEVSTSPMTQEHEKSSTCQIL